MALRYGAAERAVIKAIWLTAEQPCGKRLRPALPYYEGHTYGVTFTRTGSHLCIQLVYGVTSLVWCTGSGVRGQT
jgi:hypothetical protein